MRRALSFVGLVLVLGACGIKGSPRPPGPPPAPPTETQPSPREEAERAPLEPSGPTITPAPDGGTIVPGAETP
ncbi:hypothetical protein [Myxococcus sp. RHSTA-1-4]|uniref:hypothetical protein n=1 Tax=Myxococcus sp. RHSTA-1-4 TaxID=2874601 RepID=UPI001CBD7C58|nr:hypothetical protein [Myxococcus sp. RHSTA-1-4]MBZ4420972.1 hypothetical protein [Myxococcus sp. RHSTA-1-4]